VRTPPPEFGFGARIGLQILQEESNEKDMKVSKTISAGLEPAAFGNLAPEANALPLRHDTHALLWVSPYFTNKP